jgi:hypothetical protein
MTIYFVQNERTKSIKIGYTKGNSSDRLRTLQTASCEKLCLLSQIEGDIFLEKQLHILCIDYQIMLEWFKPECLSACENFLKKPIILCCYEFEKDSSSNIRPKEKFRRTRTSRITREMMDKSLFSLEQAGFVEVLGYEGLYSINKKGNLFSHKTQIWMKGCQRSDGCMWVGLTNSSGVTNNHRIARLVLSTFVEPRPKGDRIIHLDGNTLNNNLENLSWCFGAFIPCSLPGGSKRRNHDTDRLTDQDVRDVFWFVSTNVPRKEIAIMYGITERHVSNIQAGRRRSKALAGIHSFG